MNSPLPPQSKQAPPFVKPPTATPTPAQQALKPRARFAPPSSTNVGHRFVVYGTGGIGKTTLCASMPGKVAFIDLDESLNRLKPKLEEFGLLSNLDLVLGISTWVDLRDTLNGPGWDPYKTIVVDTGTKAEELGTQFVLDTIRHEKTNKLVNSIEGFGWGKGYTHIFETFNLLLADLDAHCRQGRNVVIVCHDCTANVPNPNGDDWIRYEPRLSSPSSGKASIRHRIKEWADHVMFLGYDVNVEEGKGKGQGTRTLYTEERPHCMAKSRTYPGVIPLTGENIWSKFIG